MELQICFWNFPVACEIRNDCVTKMNTKFWWLQRGTEIACGFPLSLYSILLYIVEHLQEETSSNQYLVVQIKSLFLLFGNYVIKSAVLLILKRSIILCLLKLRQFLMHKMDVLILVLLSVFCTKEQSLLKTFSHLGKQCEEEGTGAKNYSDSNKDKILTRELVPNLKSTQQLGLAF